MVERGPPLKCGFQLSQQTGHDGVTHQWPRRWGPSLLSGSVEAVVVMPGAVAQRRCGVTLLSRLGLVWLRRRLLLPLQLRLRVR